MIVFAVAFVLTALVVAVILVTSTFRGTTCANAPLGCERECIKLGDLTARAY